MKRKLLIPLFAACGVFTITAAGADFINGTFDATNIAMAEVFVPVGSTLLSPWIIGGTNSSSGVALHAVSVVTTVGTTMAPEGYFVVFDSANRPTGDWIEQRFDTIIGWGYQATFAVARIDRDPGEMSLTASVTDGNGNIIGRDKEIAGSSPFSSRSFRFVATTSTAVIRFTDTSTATDGVDIGLAHVQIVPTVHFRVGRSALDPTNGFRLNLAPGSRSATQIQASTNLLNWETVITFSSVTNAIEFVDPTATNFTRRFYRTISP